MMVHTTLLRFRVSILHSWGRSVRKKLPIFISDSTNSNIADIFNLQPTRLVYELDGVSNAELDNNLIGFMTDKSVLGLQMRVELVLEGSARNFGAEQTLDMDFGSFGKPILRRNVKALSSNW